ncbi:MAG: CBS domain-containing protein [Asgard group archaeon]|nr:CBS domain-containing protein [Asgard group archaeon]
MKVSEIMSTEYETIDKDQTLSKALSHMKKKDVTRLIVTQGDEAVGILTFRDVADRLGSFKTEGKSAKSLHVSSAMTFPILSIKPNDEIVDAAKMMIENRISSVFVSDETGHKGLLTKYDLLKVYDKCKKIKIKDLMTESPIQISESERVIAARNTMMEKKFSILPVMEEDKIVGIIDDETIAEALAMFREKIPIKHQKNRIQEYYVGQIMKKDPPTIQESAPLCDAVQILIDTKYKGIFVLDKTEKLVGILSITDVTKAIAEGK